jgi:hypothetical protein
VKAKQIIEILSEFDQDMDVDINVGYFHNTKLDICDVRDNVDREGIFIGQIARIVGDYRSGCFQGWPVLTEGQKQTKMERILEHLSGKTGEWFTFIHGDFRFYRPDLYGSQSTCYGEAYDPRLFVELERDGLIKREDVDYGGRHYKITPEGIHWLNLSSERIP